MYTCELEKHLKWMIKDLKNLKWKPFKTSKMNDKLEGIRNNWYLQKNKICRKNIFLKG